MKKIFVILFSLIISTAVEAALPAIDIHTPNGSKSAPFQLAKVYFLPDWSENGMKFDGTDEKPCTEVCPQKTSYDCASKQTESYVNSCGLTCTRCLECYGCEAQGYIHNPCPDNGICLNDCCNKLHKLTGCNSGYVLDGSSCRKETCSDNPSICSGGKRCVSGICQCPSGQTDVDGKCETSTCTNGGIDCSGSTSVCNISTGKCVECLANSDCSGGKECNVNNQCILPDACAGVTCSEGKSCVDGVCVECTSNSQCTGGKECSGNVCKCPSGQIDNAGTCVAGTSKTCEIGDIYYSNRECSSKTIPGLTPLGIVIDPEQRMIFHYGAMTTMGYCSSSTGWACSSTEPNISTISNEDIRNNSAFNGYFNTNELANKISSPAAQYCKSLLTFDGAILKNWYIPAKGEMKKLIDNLPAIEAKRSTTKFRPFAAFPAPLLTSSEVLSSVPSEADSMWAYDGTNFIKTYKPKSGYVRCFARYPDLNGDTSKDYALPCPILFNWTTNGYMEDATGSTTPFNGMDIGVCRAQAATIAPSAEGTPSLDGFMFDDYTFNLRCRRCTANILKTASTGGGSSGGGSGSGGGTTEPTKTPCQPGDYLYAVTTTENALCSPSLVSSRTLLGRVLYTSGDGTGVVLHHKITSNIASRNSASGSSLCSAYNLGIPNAPGGDWWLANIDELRKNSNWKSYIQGSSTTYFWIKYTSLPHLFNLKGDGPLNPGSTSERHPGICTSSFWTAYRK